MGILDVNTGHALFNSSGSLFQSQFRAQTISNSELKLSNLYIALSFNFNPSSCNSGLRIHDDEVYAPCPFLARSLILKNAVEIDVKNSCNLLSARPDHDIRCKDWIFNHRQMKKLVRRMEPYPSRKLIGLCARYRSHDLRKIGYNVGTIMSKLKKAVAETPFLGRSLLVLYRAKLGVGYFRRPLLYFIRWLFMSKETTNFTYDLEEINKRYLASLISDITNEKFDVIMSYFKEIEMDGDLRKHVADATMCSDLACIADKDVRFGRRVGWYVLTRVLKPKSVVETGVDKGLGACLLAAALKRNHAEGYEGRYYGTDINPKAGFLLSGEYAKFGHILYGDSIESLKQYDGSIDLFINDSDHSAAYEAEEYTTVADKLSEHAVILGDNSHCTDKLLDFSLKTNRHFVFFEEKPNEHWYPGAGIGISFKR